MTRNIIYWIAGVLSLGVVWFTAPSGTWLTAPPARGPVTHEAGKATIRGHVPSFWWFGGGYHGGK